MLIASNILPASWSSVHMSHEKEGIIQLIQRQIEKTWSLSEPRQNPEHRLHIFFCFIDSLRFLSCSFFRKFLYKGEYWRKILSRRRYGKCVLQIIRWRWLESGPCYSYRCSAPAGCLYAQETSCLPPPLLLMGSTWISP